MPSLIFSAMEEIDFFYFFFCVGNLQPLVQEKVNADDGGSIKIITQQHLPSLPLVLVMIWYIIFIFIILLLSSSPYCYYYHIIIVVIMLRIKKSLFCFLEFRIVKCQRT